MTPRTELRAFHVSDMTGQPPTGGESRVRRRRGAATACALLTALGALCGMLGVYGATPMASLFAAPTAKPGPVITFDVSCVKQHGATDGSADVVASAALVASGCEVPSRGRGRPAAAPATRPDTISLDASCVRAYGGAGEGMAAASLGLLVVSECGVAGHRRSQGGATARFAFVPAVGRPAGARWPALPARGVALSRRAPALSMSLFGMGPPELAIIGIAGILLLGPKNMAEFAKEAGKLAADFKKLPDEFGKGLDEFEDAEREKEAAKIQEAAKAPEAAAATEAPAAPSPTSPPAEPLPTSSTAKPKKVDLTDTDA